MPFLTLWTIWKTRNLNIFEDKTPKPKDVLFAAKNTMAELNVLNPNPNQSTMDPPQNIGSRVRWRPPCSNLLKFNTDSQFDVSTCRATIGVICRNVQGKLITSIT